MSVTTLRKQIRGSSLWVRIFSLILALLFFLEQIAGNEFCSFPARQSTTVLNVPSSISSRESGPQISGQNLPPELQFPKEVSWFSSPWYIRYVAWVQIPLTMALGLIVPRVLGFEPVLSPGVVISGVISGVTAASLFWLGHLFRGKEFFLSKEVTQWANDVLLVELLASVLPATVLVFEEMRPIDKIVIQGLLTTVPILVLSYFHLKSNNMSQRGVLGRWFRKGSVTSSERFIFWSLFHSASNYAVYPRPEGSDDQDNEIRSALSTRWLEAVSWRIDPFLLILQSGEWDNPRSLWRKYLQPFLLSPSDQLLNYWWRGLDRWRQTSRLQEEQRQWIIGQKKRVVYSALINPDTAGDAWSVVKPLLSQLPGIRIAAAWGVLHSPDDRVREEGFRYFDDRLPLFPEGERPEIMRALEQARYKDKTTHPTTEIAL